MLTYLITGGAGFIGSNLVSELVSQGHAVRVVDNFSTGHRHNLGDVLDSIDLVQGDISHPDVCRQAVAGVDYVLHHAAIPSVQRSVEDPLESHSTGATATLNLLLAARDAGVKRLVFASSSAVYGDSPELPHHEALLPQPKSPYAVSKLSAEHLWPGNGVPTLF